MTIYTSLSLTILITIGIATMTIANAQAAPTFKLKQPSHYFADKNTLAMLAAAMVGDLRSAKLAIARGADPNEEGPVENKYNRLRPLHYAIAANNKNAVKILVSLGADHCCPIVDT